VHDQALMAEISDDAETQTEVQSKLWTKPYLNTVRKYRENNQGMCDNLKKLEQSRRESSLIISNFEEQIKAYQDNEL